MLKSTVKRLAPSTWHPLPLLFWMEWSMLIVNFFSVIDFYDLNVDLPVENNLETLPWIDFSPLVPPSLLILFAGLGFWIPKRTLWRKIIYTAIELGILALAALSSSCWDCFSWSLVVVVIRSCVIFKLPGRLITAGLTFVLAVFIDFLSVALLMEELLQESSDQTYLSEVISILGLSVTEFPLLMIQEQIKVTLSIGAVLVFVLLLTNALASERQSRQQLTAAHNQLRQYALRVKSQATVEERNRIAREIHDSLGHLLTAQKIQLNNALAFLPEDISTEKVRPFVVEAKQLGVESLQELRRSLKLLRSDPLQDKSLGQLIQGLVERFQWNTGSVINAQIQLDLPVSDEVKRAVYRLLEEALTNACKYSHSAQITLQVKIHALRSELWFEIVDDGQGFDVHQNTSGFGLRGMKERILALNGHLNIESRPGIGCKISGRLPLEPFT